MRDVGAAVRLWGVCSRPRGSWLQNPANSSKDESTRRRDVLLLIRTAIDGADSNRFERFRLLLIKQTRFDFENLNEAPKAERRWR
jgi:hypothetical protein